MFATISPLLRKTFLFRPLLSVGSYVRLYTQGVDRGPLYTTAIGWNNSIGDTVTKPVHHIRTIDEIWQERSRAADVELSSRPPANAYSGRSVKVLDGNVADAYQRLHTILQRNKIRTQLKRAERHEKKGEKRRRLSSERWRKQFAHEVRKKVQLVTKIRNRGA